MYGYEWTDEYGIFRLTIDAKIQKEIRPVFHEELDFFGMDKYWDYPKDTDAPLLWAEGIRRYVMNGVCVSKIFRPSSPICLVWMTKSASRSSTFARCTP